MQVEYLGFGTFQWVILRGRIFRGDIEKKKFLWGDLFRGDLNSSNFWGGPKFQGGPNILGGTSDLLAVHVKVNLTTV